MANVVVNYKGENKEFKVIKNEDNADGIGVKVFNSQGVPVYAFANVCWWDLDNIHKSLIENMEKILECERKKMKL